MAMIAIYEAAAGRGSSPPAFGRALLGRLLPYLPALLGSTVVGLVAIREILRLTKRANHTHRIWSAQSMRELSLGAYARSIEMARALLGAAHALRDVAARVGRIIVK